MIDVVALRKPDQYSSTFLVGVSISRLVGRLVVSLVHALSQAAAASCRKRGVAAATGRMYRLLSFPGRIPSWAASLLGKYG